MSIQSATPAELLFFCLRILAPPCAVRRSSLQSQAEIVTKVLRLLGKIGDASRFLVDEAAVVSKAMAWDSTRRVRLELPFPAEQIPVFLDPLLPRLAECAEHANSPHLRLAACEALHALMTLMVAEQARSVDGRSSSPHLLYRKLFPVALRLASGAAGGSGDLLVRQIFRPFVFQVRPSSPGRREKCVRCVSLADVQQSRAEQLIERVLPFVVVVPRSVACSVVLQQPPARALREHGPSGFGCRGPRAARQPQSAALCCRMHAPLHARERGDRCQFPG